MDSIKKENQLIMIALAIFYTIIIALLFLMVCWIQKCFEIYTNIYNGKLINAIEIRKQKQNKVQDIHDFQKEINHVIQNRLSEFERKFPKEIHENEFSTQFVEQTQQTIFNILQNLNKWHKIQS